MTTSKKGIEIPDQWFSTIDCRQGTVRGVRYNIDGNYCLTCGSDKTLKLWNPERKLVLRTYTGHGYEVLDARGSCDNSELVSCSSDKTVIVWDVSTGIAKRKFRGHAGAINSVRFNEDSTLVLSGSVDGKVKCWDVRSRQLEPIQTLDECTDSVTSIDVSNYEILVGCVDTKVRRYDLRNGQLLTDHLGKPITSVCFTKDSQCVVVGANNDAIKLFDKATGELLQEYIGHVNRHYRIDTTLDNTDRLIISGSENGYAIIWNLFEAKVLSKLLHVSSELPSVTVHSLSFHPRQCELLTAAQGCIYLWKSQSHS